MPRYSLNLQIDPKDLSIIKAAQQRITLAQPVNGGEPNVIWLAIDPFQVTTVEWTGDYWIYASTTVANEVGMISQLSEVSPGPARDAACYPLSPAAVFGEPQTDGGIPGGTYAAQNNMPYATYPFLTFGLSQAAAVNGILVRQKPISASMVLATQMIQMTPFPSIYVWLQGFFGSATIVTRITGKITLVRFGGGIDQMTLKYDPARGMFAPAGADGKLIEHDQVELREPLIL